jgi:hypothetical protein
MVNAARVMRARRIGTGRLAAGVIAGALGTAAMDLVLYLQYRDDGGTEPLWQWESAESVSTWDGASAPGRVGQKLGRLVLRREPPDNWARATTNAVHWTTGTGWGLQYAAAAGLMPRHPLARALALGPAAWATSYVVLPLIGVYKPIWEYDKRTLAKDLAAHLVFGAVTGAAFAALTRGGGD